MKNALKSTLLFAVLMLFANNVNAQIASQIKSKLNSILVTYSCDMRCDHPSTCTKLRYSGNVSLTNEKKIDDKTYIVDGRFSYKDITEKDDVGAYRIFRAKIKIVFDEVEVISILTPICYDGNRCQVVYGPTSTDLDCP